MSLLQSIKTCEDFFLVQKLVDAIIDFSQSKERNLIEFMRNIEFKDLESNFDHSWNMNDVWDDEIKDAYKQSTPPLRLLSCELVLFKLKQENYGFETSKKLHNAERAIHGFKIISN